MANKTILFGMPKVSGLYKLIDKNLRHCGFNVINLVEHADEFSYPSLTDYLYVKFRKLVYRDNYAKKQLMWQTLQPQIAAAIEACGGVDHALFISGDIYSREFLQFVRGKSRNGLVNYQFDGLHRFPAIYSLMDEFNRFYVFDPNDLEYRGKHLFPATNFYFDYDLNHNDIEVGEGCYFLGVHNPSRVDVINRFGRYALKKGLQTDISVIWKGSKASGRHTYLGENIQLINKHIDFEKNLKKAKQSAILLDFTVGDHCGLSFRCFEALGYRKKLITTNAEIKKYDFYNPDNILVWDGKNEDLIDEFLKVPYCEMPSEIRKKYSFTNWLNYILQVEPYQQLELP